MTLIARRGAVFGLQAALVVGVGCGCGVVFGLQAAVAAGGPWLWSVLLPSGLVAVVVPSGLRVIFQPHWWTAMR
jgi:hypothetical protein